MRKSLYLTLIIISLFFTSSLVGTVGNTENAIHVQPLPSITARTNEGGNPLFVTFVWHQHQPSYLDPTTGYYEQPWVFMHGINDYPKMAQLMIDRPTINATMDMTGTLLRQLVDYADHTAKDRLIEMVLKQNAELTDDEKYFLFGPYPGGNLFDINGQFLVNKFKSVDNIRSNYSTWTDNEMNAAKVLFFLKWMNEEFVEGNTTLAALADKNNDADPDVTPYTHADVEYIVEAGYDIIEQVIPMHKQLVDNGQLELVTTPLAHPIGPLLLDTRSELDTSINKATAMPTGNTMWPEDLDEQIDRSNELFNDLFGRYPQGIWSPEQAVSPALIEHYTKYGIEWSITAPEQLAKVPGRSSGEDDLNQLYKVDNADHSDSMFFVYDDTELSDKVGFNYASFENQTEAVEDFMNVLYRKYTSFKDEGGDPRLATLGMDGENAWEWYPDNANQFRNELYDAIVQAQEDGWLKTTTVSKYIDEYGSSITVDHTLKTGSWINGDFTTWIGESLENRYWDELIDARTHLVSVNATLNETARANAWDSVYLAEGSDWFWWAGADQDSGNDEKFDWAFKSLLRSVYYWSGMDDEELLTSKPFLYEQLKPLSSYERDPSGESSITIDGAVTAEDEWDAAGYLRDPDGGVMEAGDDPANIISDLYVGYGAPNSDLFIRMDMSDYLTLESWNNIFFAVYFSGTGDAVTNIRTRYGTSSTTSAGFPIAFEVGVNITDLTEGVVANVNIFTANGDETFSATNFTAQVAFNGILEFAIPVDGLNAGPESTLQMAFEASASNTTVLTHKDFAPNDGPIQLTLPPAGISGELVYLHEDAIGDETGSAGPVGSTGGLQYGQNAAFEPYSGLFDLTTFAVYHDSTKEETIFEVGIETITNPWGSPYGLSHPGILIYIDQDRIPGSGGTVGVEASSADIDEFSAYEWAVQAGGWEVSWNFYSPELNDDGYPTATAASAGVNMRMVVDPNEGFVRITIADSAIGFTVDNSMGFIVATFSNDGYSPNNIRQTAANAADYKMGGQSDSTADPNVIDILTPGTVDQLSLLSNYKEAPLTYAKMTAVGEGITGEYDFVPPKIEQIFFNDGLAKDVLTNRADGSIVNVSMVTDEVLGGIWAYNSNGQLIGVSPKEKNYVQFFLVEGTHVVEIRATDLAGNIAVNTYTITVNDGYAPDINDFKHIPTSPAVGDYIKVHADVTDTHLQSIAVLYSTDNSTFQNKAMAADNSQYENGYSSIVIKYQEGMDLFIQIKAIDENGNTRLSEVRQLDFSADSDVESTPFSWMFILPLISIPILRRKILR
ncbi:MAG: hypothetical protein INQ03_16435 [Candidatus Heimdallarchaeota archaeon]|nr:hypothetical protein [Candidatus Heimdallarchaeota archaeon]